MNVKVCLLPDGDDGSFARKHNGGSGLHTREWTLSRFKTNLLLEILERPHRRAELIEHCANISIIPAIVRDLYQGA